MQNKDELLQLLDNIISCGENMAKLGLLLKEKVSAKPSTSPKKKSTSQDTEEIKTASETVSEEKEESAAKTYTFAEVRKAFAAKSHAGYTNEVKAIIQKYGDGRLSDVAESDYPALMSELEVIG